MIKKKNLDSNYIVSDMKDLQFSTITNKFELIEYIEDNVHVLILNDNKIITLHKKMINKKKIYNGFYLYSVTVKENDIINNKDFDNVKNKFGDVLYYYLKPDHTKKYYNTNTGFDMK